MFVYLTPEDVAILNRRQNNDGNCWISHCELMRMFRYAKTDAPIMDNLTRLAGLPPAVKLTLAGLASLEGK